MARQTNPLSRKYYVMVAKAIIDAYTDTRTREAFLGALIKNLAFDFKRDNRRFDADRFEDYIRDRVED